MFKKYPIHPLCILMLILAACSRQDKHLAMQAQWRSECEGMLLQGADGLLRHDDCERRCGRHYSHYCLTRCEKALASTHLNRKQIDDHCQGYLKTYINKKCSHVCQLSPTELEEYRAAFEKRIHEKTINASACQKWDKEDSFITKQTPSLKDRLNDDMNAFRETALSSISATSGQKDNDDDEDDDEDDDDDADNDTDDADDEADDDSGADQDSKSASNVPAFLKGFKKRATFSIIPEDSESVSALKKKVSSFQASRKNNQRSEVLEDIAHEANSVRDGLRALKDIRALLKGGR